MQVVKTKLIFDTSALNALAHEPDPQKTASGLGIGYQVRLSETTVSEIAATQDRARRDRLIRPLLDCSRNWSSIC